MMSKRKYVLVLLLLGLSSLGYSQNMMQNSTRALEQTAKEAAERWTLELALTAKQTALMEDKLAEFAIKKQEVLQSKMREQVKTETLLSLQLAENKDMRDILTKPQYERYIFLLSQQVKMRSEAAENAPPSNQN